MASTQEAEIVFAQKLASNEKPVSSRASVKLRRSQRRRAAEDLEGSVLLHVDAGQAAAAGGTVD